MFEFAQSLGDFAYSRLSSVLTSPDIGPAVLYVGPSTACIGMICTKCFIPFRNFSNYSQFFNLNIPFTF